LIANDVSVAEVSERFAGAYTRVTKAVNSDDKALVDELRKLYPAITDNEIANSLLLGTEGAKYLSNKLDIADIKAAETETGIKSSFGAERLAAEGINRGQARIGLSKVAEKKSGYEQASRMFGETNTQDLQKELESENLLGQTSKRTKRLASQSRAQFGGQSGITSGSLGRKKQI
jgi:acetyl-CoA acetyltransferase